MKEKNKKFDENSFRARSERANYARNSKVHAQIILVNISIALVIILAVFGVCFAKMNHKNKSDGDKEKLKVAEATATPDSSGENVTEATTVPASANVKTGADAWLRTDLDKDKPMVALTYDDGPYTPVTRKILKVLKKYDSRATFFVVGNRVPTYSETLKKAYKQGNQIASHTYDHGDLSKMKKKQILKELNKTNSAIKKVIGCKVTALRPPYGNVSSTMKKTIDIPMFYWSVDTEDWKSRNAASVVSRCSDVKDGDIILMHDLYDSTADATAKLVPKLVKKGFQLVTIDELLYYHGINAKGGTVYYSVASNVVKSK